MQFKSRLVFPPVSRLLFQLRPNALLFAVLLALLLILTAESPSSSAQQPLQVLHHHVRPEVSSKQAALVGTLPSDQQLSLSIVLPLENQAALNSLLARLYDPASPDFHHFLSVAQFTEQFGPSADTFQAVVSFAQANGFTVTEIPTNRLIVPVKASVAAVSRAFGVSMNVYQHPTENRTFFSPDREPSLPAGLQVAHINGLNNFSLPHPNLVRKGGAQPLLSGTGAGPGGSFLGSDMRAAYYAATALTGNGQSVGLLELDGYDIADVNATFANASQTYTVPVNNILLDGVTGTGMTTGGEAEVVLDIVQTIGMAPGLQQVRVYMGQDDAHILNSMATENLAKVLSSSWSWVPDDPSTENVFFQEFAAQGQSFLAASGDAGAYDSAIDPYFYPQEDAYVTAVGGTHLSTTGPGGSWSAETAWNSAGAGSGGGISPDNIGIPSWQTGIANAANAGSTTLRNAPDIAMEGDFDNYSCAMGECSGDYAGTSFAAPRWAGFLALVNQQAVEAGTAPQGGIGFVNPALYRLAQSASSSTDFHDITSGNNDTANQPIWFSAVSGYDLVTGWGSANGQSLIDDLAGPQVPGFWLQPSLPTVNVDQGTSSSTTLTVTDAGGFTGPVTLAITSALPSGVTASWATNPTEGTSVLTLTATSTAPASSTPITLTGTSGNLKAQTTVTVAVHAPTFTLSANPDPIVLNQGQTTTSTLTVTPEYGFTGAVHLAVTGLPSGVTASLDTNPTSATSVLTLVASGSAAPGTTPITLTGTAGTLSVALSLPLSIHGPSFTLQSADALDIGQGSSGNDYISVTDLYGFAGNVNLAVTGLPAGVTASFAPNPTTGSSTLTLTAAGSTPVGSSTLSISGTSGNLNATTTTTLRVHAPSFTISYPGPVDVGQGSSTSASLYVSPQYGFTGSVTFSVTGLPAGVTALWNPNPSSGSTTLTFAAANSAIVGQYPLTVTGTSGSQTATASTTLNIHQPSFTLSASNTSLGQGTSTTAFVNINPQYGFTGSVNLSVTGLPSGVTASFSPNPTTGNTTLTLTASTATATGQYTVTVTGTSGARSATATFTLGVYQPTFTLFGYNVVNIGQGTSGTSFVNINPEYGFTGSVTLSVSGLPAGVTAAFSPNPTTSSATLTLTASTTATLGQYNATVTGTSGTQTVTMPLTVGVYVPTFTLTSQGSVSVGQGSAGTSFVSIYGQYGFNGSVTLSVSGLPAGVTAAFSPNPTTGSGLLTLSAASTAPVGQYNLTVTGVSGSQTASTPLTLGIYAPSFTLSSDGQASIGQGTSSTSYVFVNGQYGFNGNVNLAVSGLPTGVTASFSPNPTTGNSTLSFAASSNAVLGQYTLTITGTSGTATAATTLTLGVYAPGFLLSGGSGNLTLNQGGSGTASFFLTDQYGFSSPVTLSASGLPSGITASFSPNPTTYSSTVTLTASPTAAPGQTNVTITGTSGALISSTSLPVTVNASDFALADAPGQVSLATGSSANSIVTVLAQNGFAAPVTLAITGLPAGVTASFSANPISTTGTLTLTASSSASPGSSTATITGTSGALTSTIPLQVTLIAAPTPTATVLAISSAGASVTSVASPAPVTLTASVTAGSTPLTAGQVTFCSAATCDSTHSIGTAQISTTGTASLTFIPGPGPHTYTALFSGTTGRAPSTSAAASLSVSAAQASTTTIAQSGTPGQYTLAATVTGQGSTAPSGSVSFLDTTNNNAVLGTASLTPAQPALTFANSLYTSTSFVPSTIAVADFNGDGKPDVATVNQTGNSLNILLGNGDGTFTPGNSSLPTGNQPFTVLAADFNADGKIDLAVANINSSSISIFLGNGDGTFTPSSFNPQAGTSPGNMVVGDFNGDGKVDLAVVNGNNSSLTILLGNGDGTFTPSQLSPQTGAGAGSIITADFNGDGVADLAFVNTYSNTVSILLGNGDGSFSAAASIATPTYPTFVVTGDFNHDGKADLALVCSINGTITVLLGNGDSTFTASTITVPQVYSINSLAVADLNNDGNQDLVFSTYGSTMTLLGNGDGTFTAGPSATFSSGGTPSIALADLNGDGVPDIVDSNNYAMNIAVFPGQLAQTSQASVTGINPSGSGLHAVEAAYAGDTVWSTSTSSTTQLSAQPLTPTLTVTPSASSITTAQPVTVTVVVTGPSGSPSPTGTVTLTSGTYTAAPTPLIGGTAIVTVPAGSLPAGTAILAASFTPDATSASLYSSASGSATLTVTTPPKTTPAVTLSVSATTITSAQPITITTNVTTAPGGATPTGTVTLTGAGYMSAAISLSNGSASITVPANSLSIGSDTLTASYAPDAAGAAAYNSANGSLTLTVTNPPRSPAINLTLSAPSITTTQTLTVAVNLSASIGSPVPTGSITLVGGAYSAQQTLTAGATTFTLSAGSLPVGGDTLKATYNPDAASTAAYTAAIQTASVTVAPAIGTNPATVTLTASPATVTDLQGAAVTVTVAGAGSQASPTGTITLTTGTYNAQQTLANGAASFALPAGTLSDGQNTVTAAYSGDPTFAPANATTTVTASSLLITASAPPSIAPGAVATSTVTLTAGTYAGTMNLTCLLVNSPAGAQSLPTCKVNPAALQVSSGADAASTLSLSTTPPATSLATPPTPWKTLGLGTSALASLLVLLIPSRRRLRLPLLALLLGVLGMAASGCSSGNNASTPAPPTATPATTSGQYTFTITGVDATNPKFAVSTSVTLTVQ